MTGGGARTNKAPVIIVGAGPIGLALALDLAQRGWRSIVIEREAGHQVRAKAAVLNERTMELCRRWGIVDRVAGAGFPNDYPADMTFCTSLNGYTLGRETLPSANDRVPPPGSPEILRWCPQMWFDPLLAQAAVETGLVDIRERCTFDDYVETDDGVHVSIAANHEGATTLEAQYLIACDGVGSGLRRSLGIPFEGNPALSFSVNALIRMPGFLEAHDKGRSGLYLVVSSAGIWCNFTCVNGRDLWRFTLVGSEERAQLSDAEVAAEIRRAFGRDDIDFEIISNHPWRRSACTAARFRASRVFLAGDSAHSMSSTGGFGMNTGMGDVSNLGWKLDAVLRGWGGEQLLDSYEAERRPVALRNIRASTAIFNAWTTGRDDWARLDENSPEGEAARKSVGENLIRVLRPEWVSTGVALGYRYEGSPIVIPDGTPEPPDTFSEYEQTARPGHRAPHAFLRDGRSMIDLFGAGFVLLRFGGDAVDTASLSASAAARGVPLTVVDIADPAIAELYERPLVLVRPDGHTAWRGETPTLPEAERIIDCARGAVPISAQGPRTTADAG